MIAVYHAIARSPSRKPVSELVVILAGVSILVAAIVIALMCFISLEIIIASGYIGKKYTCRDEGYKAGGKEDRKLHVERLGG